MTQTEGNLALSLKSHCWSEIKSCIDSSHLLVLYGDLLVWFSGRLDDMMDAAV